MATSPKQNELLQLQSEITAEVNRDAPAIAQGVFGDNKNHPDMAQVPNTQLDDLYRQKFQSGTAVDRQWLQGEARRDPQQFLDVAKRIGVAIPQPTPPPSAPAPPAAPMPAMPVGLPAAAPVPAPPPALPAPPVAPVAAPPALPVAAPVGLAAPAPPPGPPPVILGPNGQPLPPTGLS